MQQQSPFSYPANVLSLGGGKTVVNMGESVSTTTPFKSMGGERFVPELRRATHHLQTLLTGLNHAFDNRTYFLLLDTV